MSYRFGLTVLVLVGVFDIAAITADKPPETYQNAMKDLGAFAQGIGKAVSDNDYDAIQKYSVSAVNAFTVGQLLYLLETATVATGALAGVDPFGQPGVEEGKRLAYGLMGRPGFDAGREEVEAWVARKDARFII